MTTTADQKIRALATDDHYPAVLKLFEGAPKGRILDVPAGHGAFAQELVKLGYSDIHCLDINAEAFVLKEIDPNGLTKTDRSYWSLPPVWQTGGIHNHRVSQGE